MRVCVLGVEGLVLGVRVDKGQCHGIINNIRDGERCHEFSVEL